MPNRTFIWFIMPSALIVLIFIVAPMVSIVLQSFYVEHDQVMVSQEVCGPFQCETQLNVDDAAMQTLRREHPMGKFNGLLTYADRAHLALAEVGALWRAAPTTSRFLSNLYELPFYRALAFTLAFTFVVTPLAIVVGFAVAFGVNALPKILKGPAIFFSLLPMIITPLIGSLILFWMIDARGILGAALQSAFHDPQLSLKASVGLTWATLFTYGVWGAAPFAFVIFYAALQTVPLDTLESAMVDGATRWQRIRYVIVPYLAPVTTFVALIMAMDNFRVFEPIIGFNAEANAGSLSWLIYRDLRSSGSQLFGSAAATSVMTILGVSVLLMPVLLQARRDFNRRR